MWGGAVTMPAPLATRGVSGLVGVIEQLPEQGLAIELLEELANFFHVQRRSIGKQHSRPVTPDREARRGYLT